MVAATPADAADIIDARPIRATSNQTPWDKALALRDQLAAEVRKTLEREHLEAAVFVSGNGNYPPWVRLEAWLPGTAKSALAAHSRERASLAFTIDIKPYHEHEIVVGAQLERGKVKIAVDPRPDFPERCVGEWVLYALDRGRKPSNYAPVLDAIERAVTALIPFVPGPDENRIAPEYRTRFTGAMALALSSLVLLWFGVSGMGVAARDFDAPGLSLLIVVLGIAGLIGALLWRRSRTRTVCVTTQSALPPRDLGQVDRWHAVLAELGREFESIRARLIRVISEEASPGVSCHMETYTYRAPNGYEERERLVVAKDQGMVHVHIYRFGDDLFVGWYAYLNWAQWGETKPVGVKIRSGQEIEYRDLRPMIYVPNQFDFIDLSSLSEFVHRRLEREIKTIMKEKEVDQEIDFKIIRGDRDRALDEERHAADDKKRSGATAWSYRS